MFLLRSGKGRLSVLIPIYSYFDVFWGSSPVLNRLAQCKLHLATVNFAGSEKGEFK